MSQNPGVSVPHIGLFPIPEGSSDRPDTRRIAREVIAPPPAPPEETLVADDRAGLSPAQLVEHKLSRILNESILPVSHLQMRGLLKSR